MSRPAIAFLALRLTGLYCWFAAFLKGLAAAIVLILNRDLAAGTEKGVPGAVKMGLLSEPILIFACGCLLFFWAPLLANKMFRDAPSESDGFDGGLGGLALRLVGILLAIRVLQLAPTALDLPESMRDGPLPTAFMPVLVAIAVLTLVSAWLILSGPKIARWLLRSRSADVLDVKSLRFQTIAFSIVGVWILVGGLPSVIVMIADHVSRGMHPYNQAASSVGAAQQWTSVVQVIVGAALFLGSHGLSSLWHRDARAAGLAEPRVEPSEETG